MPTTPYNELLKSCAIDVKAVDAASLGYDSLKEMKAFREGVIFAAVAVFEGEALAA